MASNNNNSNPFGLNLGNVSNMQNVFLSLNSNVERGDVNIRTVNDPKANTNGSPGLKNVFVDIDSKKVEGNITLHDTPLIPVPGRAPVNAARQAQVQAPSQQVSIPQNNAPPVQNPDQSSAASSSKPEAAASSSPRAGDTSFLVEDTEIKAFKVVLATKSKIFDHLIKKALPNTKIPLPNVKAATFEAMLRYFDNENDDSVKQNAADLLPLAQKYGITDLKTKVETILMQKMDFNTAAPYLLLAERNKAAKLKAKAIEYINGCPSIKKTDAFEAIRDEEPSLLMELE